VNFLTDNEVNKRYFLVSYRYEFGFGHADIIVQNGFLNHEKTIENIRAKIDGYNGGIAITSIYEFKNKDDYDDFTKKIVP
jgi:hypothetical protein